MVIPVMPCGQCSDCKPSSNSTLTRQLSFELHELAARMLTCELCCAVLVCAGKHGRGAGRGAGGAGGEQPQECKQQ